MTPALMKTLAQKRVKTNTTNIDWDSLYAIVIDEIFTERPFKFARQDISYTHSASTFEKQFNANATEKALNSPIAVRVTTAGKETWLEYMTPKDFFSQFPDVTEDGDPKWWILTVGNDGTNGAKIGLFPRPSAGITVSVYGDFIPSYTIDSNPMPILPKQYHRMVVDGLIVLAAEEAGLERLQAQAQARFNRAMKKLVQWDIRNPAYDPRLKSYELSVRKGPRFPSNFPVGYS